MNGRCFLCSAEGSELLKNAVHLFKKDASYLPSGRRLSEVVSEIIDSKITVNNVSSDIVCNMCFKTCIDYEEAKLKIENTKRKFTEHLKNNKMSNPNKKVTLISKPLVLPKSKLQPLPSDFKLNFAKALNGNIVKPKTIKTSSSTINLKVTVGTSVFTNSIKTTGPKTTQVQTEELITSASPSSSNVNIISTVKIPSLTLDARKNINVRGIIKKGPILSFDVGNLNADIISSGELESVDPASSKIVKYESEELENNDDEHSMDVDEECSYIISSSPSDKDHNEENSKAVFDVNLIQSMDANDQDTKYILEKIMLREKGDHINDDNDDDDDDEHTIVLDGDSNSILRVLSQQCNAEGFQLLMQGDGDDAKYNEGNEESQIELQVSGDEDTANAIIAAAREQGGAFIKVESGEMYRVQSVHSKKIVPEKIEPSVEHITPIVIRTGNEFICSICEANKGQGTESTVGDAEFMMTHVKKEHDAKVYICQICNELLPKRSDYATHLTKHHQSPTQPDKSKQHECTVCNKRYSSRTLLSEHMNSHSGSRPYSCNVCGRAYASKYTLQAHLKIHLDRPRPYKCDQCSKSFYTQQNLNQHEKTHSGVKNFVCNVCNKAFGTQHNLEVHGVVHSGERPFVCAVCGKGFARRAEVRDHMRIHTGERPFSCDVCGAAFAQRSNLLSHKRATHMDDKRYGCPQCPKRFKRRRLLDYHIKGSHTGERPLRCDICSATFVYPEHYKKHIRIHSGDKPYVCEICGKTFNSRDNRNTHRFIHSDKKPYECVVCGAGFMRKNLLLTHMKNSNHLAESMVINQPTISNKPSPSHSVGLETEGKAGIIDTLDSTILQELILDEADSKNDLNDEDLEASVKPEIARLLEGLTSEQLQGQKEIMVNDESGALMRLVQIQLPDGNKGWIAVND